MRRKERNIDVPSLGKNRLPGQQIVCPGNKSFARATNCQRKELKINMDGLKQLQEEATINGNTAVVELLREEIEEEGEEAIVFKFYGGRAHEVDRIPEKIMEVALGPIWEKVDFLKRGRTCRSMKVIVDLAGAARLSSKNSIKTDEVNLIPMYMGRRMTRLRVLKDPPPKGWPTQDCGCGIEEH